jgi:diguanylate cyclase (GGDEF)-like protein/PAS domain S-box-containing protein
MRYLRYIAGSPKLIAQLLLLVVIAGIVGGTGLIGLFTARGAVTAITSKQVPAIVHLLNTQRYVAESNYAGLTAMFDPDKQRTVQVDLPRIFNLSALVNAEFQQFVEERDQTTAEGPLVASVSRLLIRWRAAANQAKLLTRVSTPLSPAVVLAAYAIVDSSIVNPLSDDLSRLVKLNIQDINEAHQTADSSTTNAVLLLWAVTVVTALFAGAFQVAFSARAYRRGALAQQTGDLIAVVDIRGKFLFASPSHERLLGYRPTKLVGRLGIELVHPADRAMLSAALADLIQDVGGSREEEVRFLHADGTYRWLVISGVNKLHDPLVAGIVVTSRDVSARKQSEAALEFQASHDALTTLPNRFLMLESIERALKVAAAESTLVSLLIFDIKRFKEVNDALGHAAGDLLLLEVGHRLAMAVRANDFVARAGGNEFAVLSPEASESTAQGLAHRLSQALEAPFHLAGRAISVEASIGIALFPAHGENAQAFVQHAEAAMYEAKRRRGGAEVYTAALDDDNVNRLALGQELRQAIQDNRLTMHFQPKVDPVRGLLLGVEALSRWKHPEHGFIPPDQFIPLAELNGLIEPLTAWVLMTAIRQSKAWQNAGRTIPVAINLSARTLQNHEFPNEIGSMLKYYDLDPENLTLEITESSIMSDPVRALDVLSRLHALGVQLSIDDFGTGYSSLGYLKELPVQEVKIDKSFILGLGGATDTKNSAIVRSIIALAHALRLKVVAEGVEDGATMSALADLKCDTIQGYYISRPLSSSDFEKWLRSTAIDSSPQIERGSTQPLPAVA